MTITLAFDVYGTLIDTQGVLVLLQKHVGEHAALFSRSWRDKQLEYSFRRGLMQNYVDFSVCTRQALEYTSNLLKLPLDRNAKEELIDAYADLPAFADVAAGLVAASNAGFRLFAFSNGRADAVTSVLSRAGIRDHFLGVVSVDELKTFKPSPAVYSHFLRQAGALGADAWLVSSNPFDVIGAISSGMRAVWVRRSAEAVFDPWGIEPTLIVSSFAELAEQIGQYRGTA